MINTAKRITIRRKDFEIIQVQEENIKYVVVTMRLHTDTAKKFTTLRKKKEYTYEDFVKSLLDTYINAITLK